jgi:AbrB family looped-hinge helix DNA binding protein
MSLITCPRASSPLTIGLEIGSLTGKTNREDAMTTATTTLSSKGQVVIPEEIRERLGLKPGTQFVVVADRDAVVFKVLNAPKIAEFQAVLAKARETAKRTGMRRSDITKAIAEVRRKR